MKNEYPDHKTYRALYLRYLLGRNDGELISLLQLKPGDRLLDLCCGEGQMTLRALALGAGEAVAVDAEPAMIGPELQALPNVRILTLPVREALLQEVVKRRYYDAAVCRQAVNYWLDEDTALLAADALEPGRIFAFNTFNERPSETPTVRQYKLDDHDFVETSWLVGDTVHHLQVRDGLPPHYTTFRWLSPERLHALLDPYFTVVEERRGKTSLYQCWKK